jgi:hypothetical protein
MIPAFNLPKEFWFSLLQANQQFGSTIARAPFNRAQRPRAGTVGP